jgi:GNAT superfamily N-acetyltransferase
MAQGSDVTKAQVQKRLVPAVGPSPIKDVKSNADRQRATSYQNTPQARRNIRAVYEQQPTPQRSAIAHHATGAPLAAVAREHNQRIARNLELAQSAAKKDTKGNKDYYRGRPEARIDRSHTELVNLAREIIGVHAQNPSPGVQGDTKGALESLTADAFKLTPEFESDLATGQQAGDAYTKLKADQAKAKEDAKYSGSIPKLGLGFISGKGPVAAGLKAGAEGALSATTGALQALHLMQSSDAPQSIMRGLEGGGRIGENAAKELVNFPANVVPSIYHVATPAVEGLVTRAGNPNSPAAGQGLAESGKRIVQPYGRVITQPGKAFTENPLTSLAMLYGGAKALDRGAGRIEQGAYPHLENRTTVVSPMVPGRKAGFEDVNSLRDHPSAPQPGTPAFNKVVDKATKAGNLKNRGGTPGEKAAAAATEKRILDNANLEKTPHGIVPKKIHTSDVPIAQPKVGSRNAAIKNRAKARSDATPTVEKLAANVKPGKPGLAIESEYVRQVDPHTGDTVGFGGELHGTKVVVKRDKDGKVIGAMQIFIEKDGKPGLTSIAVDKAHQGKGIGSELINFAQKSGYDMSAAAKHPDNAFTAAGAALRHKATVNDPLKVLKVNQYKGISGKSIIPEVTRTDRIFTTKPSRPYAPLEEKLPGTAASNIILPRQGAVASRLQKRAHVGRMSDTQIERRVDETYYTSIHQSRQEAYAAIAKAKAAGMTEAEATKIGHDTLDSSREHWRDETVKDMALRDSRGRLRTFAFIDGKGGAASYITKWGQNLINQANRRVEASMTEWEHGTNKKVYKGAKGKDVQMLVPRQLNTGPNKGKFVLMPKLAADRLDEHNSYLKQTPASAILQAVSGTFRRVVLPNSPKWLGNNYSEAALRGAINGIGPISSKEGKSVFGQLSPAQQKEWNHLVKSVGHGGMQRQLLQEAPTWAEKFANTNSKYERFGNALSKFGQSPGPKTLGNLYNKWTDLVFSDLNGRMENSVHTAMAGKILRRHPLMSQKLVDLSQKAFKDPEGAATVEARNNLIALGREVDRMFGKYGKFSPFARRSIATWTPFIPWTLNAVHFITQHLPNDHPVALSLAASAHQAAQEWRNKHGLGYFIDGQVKPWMQGAIPGGNGSHWMIFTQGTPFAVWGDPTGTIAKGFNPLGSTILANLSGRDWKGDPIKGANPGKNLETAILSFLESTTPIGYALEKTTGGSGSVTTNLKNWAQPYHAIPAGKQKGGSKSPFDQAPASSGGKNPFDSGKRTKSSNPFDG